MFSDDEDGGKNNDKNYRDHDRKREDEDSRDSRDVRDKNKGRDYRDRDYDHRDGRSHDDGFFKERDRDERDRNYDRQRSGDRREGPRDGGMPREAWAAQQSTGFRSPQDVSVFSS